MKILFKALLLVSGMVLYGSSAQAQAMILLLFGNKVSNPNLEMGLQLALHESFLTGTKGIPRSSLGIGTYLDYRFKPDSKWLLSAYLTFKAPKGMSSMDVTEGYYDALDTFSNASILRKITYFSITPMARYQVNRSFSIAMGPEVGFRTFSKDVYRGKNDNGNIEYTVKTKDHLSRVDAGVALDFQYRLMKGRGLRLNARYVQSFTNVYKSSEPQKAMNCLIHLGVGIRLGRPPEIPASATKSM
jgi:hypothetical protein